MLSALQGVLPAKFTGSGEYLPAMIIEIACKTSITFFKALTFNNLKVRKLISYTLP